MNCAATASPTTPCCALSRGPTSTQHNIAREEALVFAPLSIGGYRILRWRGLRVVELDRLRVRPRGRSGIDAPFFSVTGKE